MENIDWIYNLKDEVSGFLNHQKSEVRDGYYKYSYSGDIYNEEDHWNVGSSVFALRCYYSLGFEKNMEIKNIANYIKSFKKNDLIYDDFLYQKTFVKNFLSSLKHRNFNNLFNKKYKRAETRQAYASLMLYDELPQDIMLQIPLNKEEIENYLSSFNWAKPWDAGSHFSHLLFFLKLAFNINQIDENTYKENTEYAVDWLNRIQNDVTGGWYRKNPDTRYIINGIMKVITGFIAIDKYEIAYPEKIIDLCLESANDKHACDNFNIILVLYYVNKVTGSSYRKNEINNFAMQRLEKYKAHYKKEQGGFSFHPYHSNHRYYGAKIAKGLNEADIHGTFLFLYGISLIAELLDINNELDFKVYTT